MLSLWPTSKLKLYLCVNSHESRKITVFSYYSKRILISVSFDLTTSCLYWELPHKVLWSLLKCMAYGIMNYSPVGGNSTDVTSFFCISSVTANLQIPKWGNLYYDTSSNKPPIWKTYSREPFWAVLSFPGSWTEQLNRQPSAQGRCALFLLQKPF